MSSYVTPPVLQPSSEQFNDFGKYIDYLIDQGCYKYGIVRIIPPKTWTSRKDSSNYAACIKPVLQTVKKINGYDGIYEYERTYHPRKLSLDQFKKEASKEKHLPNCETVNWDEEKFWAAADKEALKGLYGADVDGSFMDDSAGQWNFGKLAKTTILSAAGPYLNIVGISRPFLYFGSVGTFFTWHREDCDLFSINYLHYGEPKTWYGFSAKYATEFEDYVKEACKQQFEKCKAPMTHKPVLVRPTDIIEKTTIRITKVIQQAGEIIITFPRAYHSGFNHGDNCAEASNFATPFWLNYGLAAKRCSCGKDIPFPLAPFVKKFAPKDYFKWIFGQLRVHVPDITPSQIAIAPTNIDYDFLSDEAHCNNARMADENDDIDGRALRQIQRRIKAAVKLIIKRTSKLNKITCIMSYPSSEAASENSMSDCEDVKGFIDETVPAPITDPELKRAAEEKITALATAGAVVGTARTQKRRKKKLFKKVLYKEYEKLGRLDEFKHPNRKRKRKKN